MRTKTTRKVRRIGRNGKHPLIRKTTALLGTAMLAKGRLIGAEKDVVKFAKQNPFRTMGFSLLGGVLIAQLLHLHR